MRNYPKTLTFLFILLFVFGFLPLSAQQSPNDPPADPIPLPLPEGFRDMGDRGSTSTNDPIIQDELKSALDLPESKQEEVRATYDCATQSQIPLIECQALVTLYNNTKGDTWTNNTGWLITTTPCAWYGITCVSGNVYDLDLSGNNLEGSIPPELGNLSELAYLDLYLNKLSGIIPAEIGNLTNLIRLYLDNNDLTGSIPVTLGNLTALERLSLDNNDLTGFIPSTLGNLSNLQRLYLYVNNLSGSIPPELGQLTNLIEFDLHSNNLTGSIPWQLSGMTNVDRLFLYSNKLTGSIPSELGQLANLTWLAVYSNRLTGSIPASLGDIAGLRSLQISSNNLSGTIPSNIGNLTNLERLDADNNFLEGAIPSTFGSLNKLQELDLSHNRLNSVPSQIGNLANLIDMDLSDNLLTGVPSTLGNLVSLTRLDLGGNQLASIPSNISNANLVTLDISRNNLSTLPTNMSNVQSLFRIDASHNNITVIPADMGNMVSLSELDLSYNLLTDLPQGWVSLSQLWNDLKVLDLSNNRFAIFPSEITLVAYTTTSLVELYLNDNLIEDEIPSGLANSSLMEILRLDGNKLKGDIPSTLTKLQVLTELDLGYNQFELVSTEIVSWANSFDPDWAQTQTITPSGIYADTSELATNGKVRIVWEPILYKEDGYYEVFCSVVPDVSPENFDFSAITADKASSSVTFSGLPAQTYYCAVRTITDTHPNNANQLISELSDEVVFTVPQNFPPVNNNFEDRILIEAYPFLYYTTSMLNATLEPEAPLPTCGSIDPANAKSIYFALEDGGPSDANYWGEIGASLPGARGFFGTRSEPRRTIIAAYLGDSLANLTEIACDVFDSNGKTKIEFNTTRGGNYTIIIWDAPLSGAVLEPRAIQSDLLTQEAKPLTFDETRQCALVTDVSQVECQALVNLHDALNGREWTSTVAFNANTWRRFNKLCEWYGVSCDENRSVISLNLSGQNLNGEIPPSISDLDNVQVIDLSKNQLTGVLPIAFTSLSNTVNTLDLSGNQLNYVSDDILTQFEHLSVLDIGYNQFDARTLDQETIDLFDSLDPDWQSSQTIAPSNIEVTPINGNTLIVTWTPIPYQGDSGYYNIGYRTSPDQPYIVAGNTTDKTSNNFTFSGLTPEQSYEIAVRTVTLPHANNPGKVTSNYSHPVSVIMPDGTGLTKPTSLGAQTLSHESIQLNWVNNALDATEYRVERTTGSLAEVNALMEAQARDNAPRVIWTEIAQINSVVTSYVDNDPTLDPEQPYTYRVRAYRASDGVYSDYSNMSSAVLLPPVRLQSPMDTTVTTLPTFSWTPMVSASQYVLFLRNESGSYQYTEVINASNCGSTCNVSPLFDWHTKADKSNFNNTMLEWRIEAQNSGGISLYQTDFVSFNTEIPGKASLSSPATNALVGFKYPAFRWNAVFGVAKYTLYLRDTLDPARLNYKTNVRASDYCGVVGLTLCEFQPPDGAFMLEDGRQYEWYIRTKKSGYKTFSDSRFFTHTTQFIPPPPILITPENNATVGAQPTFVWDYFPQAQSYKLIIKNLSDKSKIKLNVPTTQCDGISLECSLDFNNAGVSLTNGITYKWKVKVVNVYGKNKSSARKFTVAE